MNATKACLGCMVWAALAAGCGAADEAAGGAEPIATVDARSTPTNDQIPPQASAVTVNHNGVHKTWLFMRGTDNNLYVRMLNLSGYGDWSDWYTMSVGDMGGKPWATVWKKADGKDYPVAYMLGNDGVIWALYIDQDSPTTASFWVNASNVVGLTAWQFPNIYGAVNIGYDSATITHLLVADSSKNLFTIENDFGSTGVAVHKVFQQSSTNQVKINSTVPTLALDGETIAGRNLVSGGPDTVVWKATRNQTAKGYKVDWSSASGAAWGVPIPGRFPSNAGVLTNGTYYLTDGATHKLRSSNSTGTDLCTFLTGGVAGSPAWNAHGIFVPYNGNELLQLGKWAGTTPGVCYKWNVYKDFVGTQNTIVGTPFAADESQLQGWTPDDGADIFWRINSSTGPLFHCRITGLSPICDSNSNATWVANTSIGMPTPFAGP